MPYLSGEDVESAAEDSFQQRPSKGLRGLEAGKVWEDMRMGFFCIADPAGAGRCEDWFRWVED